MSKKEYPLNDAIVEYICTHYKDALLEVAGKFIETGVPPDIKLVQENGTLYLEITFKDTL
jgi:hypothetical protein